MTPSAISGCPNFAVSEAIMISHIMASSQPPPSAKPDTAAIVGFLIFATSMKSRNIFDMYDSTYVLEAISLMSAPAANDLSEPKA